jgi:hypothetical protein
VFVGFEVERNRLARTLKLTQAAHAAEAGELCGLTSGECKGRTTPLSKDQQLTKAGPGQELREAEAQLYRSLVGKLMWMANGTRPDIQQAVSTLARYMSRPSDLHLRAAKSTLRYVMGTPSFGLVYRASSSSCNTGPGALEGFGDADFAGDLDSRRSTTGFVFLLNGAAISWQSRLQKTVAVSTAEAEYMAAGAAVKEALWLRKLLSEALGGAPNCVPLWSDNQAALKLLKDAGSQNKTKHIDVLHHFARERVARGEVSFAYIPTAHMIADCMTKPLPEKMFVTLRDAMCMRA